MKYLACWLILIAAPAAAAQQAPVTTAVPDRTSAPAQGQATGPRPVTEMSCEQIAAELTALIGPTMQAGTDAAALARSAQPNIAGMTAMSMAIGLGAGALPNAATPILTLPLQMMMEEQQRRSAAAAEQMPGLVNQMASGAERMLPLHEEHQRRCVQPAG